MDYFLERGELIRAFLRDYLGKAAETYETVRPQGPEACLRILDFSLPGKLMRGGLVSLGRDLWADPPANGEDPAVRVGAAMELVQSAFLIHDDIMDRDSLRRGGPSFFWRYKADAEAAGQEDAYHQGEAMGICGGDAALFLAFELLGSPGLPPGLSSFCAREFAAVAFGQMMDVASGASRGMPSEEEIVRLYTWKTGRYSFSVPLASGALLAGRGEGETSALERVGELAGLAFQMRDDELGLFGDPAETGKPVGSDLREGKKTLLMAVALEGLGGADREALEDLLGKKDASDEEVGRAAELVKVSGARRLLYSRMTDAILEAEGLVDALEGARPEAVSTMKGMLDFCVSRRK